MSILLLLYSASLLLATLGGLWCDTYSLKPNNRPWHDFTPCLFIQMNWPVLLAMHPLNWPIEEKKNNGKKTCTNEKTLPGEAWMTNTTPSLFFSMACTLLTHATLNLTIHHHLLLLFFSSSTASLVFGHKICPRAWTAPSSIVRPRAIERTNCHRNQRTKGLSYRWPPVTLSFFLFRPSPSRSELFFSHLSLIRLFSFTHPWNIRHEFLEFTHWKRSKNQRRDFQANSRITPIGVKLELPAVIWQRSNSDSKNTTWSDPKNYLMYLILIHDWNCLLS